MGLTWIDHDTIEKPIEEITLGTEEADDIEFTVETLKSANAASDSNNKKNLNKKVHVRSIFSIYIFWKICYVEPNCSVFD